MTGERPSEAAPGLLLRLEAAVRRLPHAELWGRYRREPRLLRPAQGQAAWSRMPAYFFRDPERQLPVTANLYHEVSHQFLFETAGPNALHLERRQLLGLRGTGHLFRDRRAPARRLARGRRPGRPADRGGDQVAGGPRARRSRWPSSSHSATSRSRTMIPGVYLHYQQAMALTVFLMQWHEGTYRDAFLDYVRDAYRGRIKRRRGTDAGGPPGPAVFDPRGPVPGLPQRMAGARENAPKPVAAKPASGGAIRTVPMPVAGRAAPQGDPSGPCRSRSEGLLRLTRRRRAAAP